MRAMRERSVSAAGVAACVLVACTSDYQPFVATGASTSGAGGASTSTGDAVTTSGSSTGGASTTSTGAGGGMGGASTSSSGGAGGAVPVLATCKEIKQAAPAAQSGPYDV